MLPSLPPGTTYLTRRMDPTVFPILAYSLTSPTVPQVALRDLAQYRLVPLLSSIPGVARVSVQGGRRQDSRSMSTRRGCRNLAWRCPMSPRRCAGKTC